MKTPDQAVVIDTLHKARQLISDPRRWHRNTLARDVHGVAVTLEDPNAWSFCALGAAARVAPSGVFHYVHQALEAKVPDGLRYPSVANFNDDPQTQHADVIKLYDRTIKAEEAKL